MDTETRKRYKKWKRKRIKRRVIFPGIGLLFMLVVLISIIVAYNSGERAKGVGAIEVNESESIAIEPLVYIYNAHPLEMIGSTHHDLFTGEMNIVELSYILATRLESHGISTLVEAHSVDEKLRENNWEFDKSYYAAGYFVQDAIAKHPSLNFFLDLHRDGIPHEYATAEIDGDSYAQVLFVIGTDNPKGYDATYAVAKELHQMLEERSPGISRGIFFSGGAGRDGVYSQDISSMVQLVEVGTVDSTVEEVSRTIDILAEVFAEYMSQLTVSGT